MGAGQSGGFEVGGSPMGYQVLRVYPNSPGSRAGLKAYFDFIVAINNTRFDKENGALREILKASVDQKLKMVVFNTRTKKVREVEIVPSTNWGGNGLLGVSIKHSSFDKADERVWHVVEVENGSPAQQAGFKANEDYVIGSDSILQENDDLYNLIETHEGKALKLFVYNVNQDNCREVVCHPNSKWGGRGYLGCEFGHGLLHRIPYEGGSDEGSDNPKASLLRNQQQPAMQDPNPQLPTKQMANLNFGSFGGIDNNNTTTNTSANTNANNPSANMLSFQNQLLNKPPPRSLDTPGYHKFQQALLGQSALQPQQQSMTGQQPTSNAYSQQTSQQTQLMQQQPLGSSGYNIPSKQQSPPESNGPPLHLQLAPQSLPPPSPPAQDPMPTPAPETSTKLQEPLAPPQPTKNASDSLGFPLPPNFQATQSLPPPPPVQPIPTQVPPLPPMMPQPKGLDDYPTPPFGQAGSPSSSPPLAPQKSANMVLPPPPPPMHDQQQSQQPPVNPYQDTPSYRMYQPPAGPNPYSSQQNQQQHHPLPQQVPQAPPPPPMQPTPYGDLPGPYHQMFQNIGQTSSVQPPPPPPMRMAPSSEQQTMAPEQPQVQQSNVEPPTSYQMAPPMQIPISRSSPPSQ